LLNAESSNPPQNCAHHLVGFFLPMRKYCAWWESAVL
jgi:hypothetical protein